MADPVIKQRPATVPFGKDEGKTSYPAKVIENPFASRFGPEEIDIDNAYRNKNGDILLSTTHDWYVMPKGGKEAYKIKSTGTATTSSGNEGIIGGKVTFATDVMGKNSGILKIDENTRQASFDGQPLSTLSAQERSELLESSKKTTTFLGLPDVREIEQALQLPDKTYLIVSASKTDYSYDTLRVFKGKDLKHLEEIPVTDVQCFRDGGTTYYKTKEGTLFSPTPFERDKATTWTPADSKEPIELKKLDRNKISKEIGESDTRIIGIKTWDEYLKESEKPKGVYPKLDPKTSMVPDDLQKKMQQYAFTQADKTKLASEQGGSGVSTGDAMPPKTTQII